ncbi:MAG: hypothetical protein CL858_10630 [Cupriavidus sp.]|jgi:hypothetical protein|uniref:hypothetical protein n=1 Tax=Cupriavidus pauculus TaxID=82633 RepID=UPI000784A707|nr:hypothetical protein [Cupriavidus pauculus]MBU65893.1 hypothetical protein [Cupriavidus sp.]KAB0603534.1 hypothetical protein F7R19_08530 [Cupriavidus pauculus]MBY4731949.1 hypothetical protein [Cupriavidus pauculus]MCM3605737.1 hypothetical protein [Cupriavidus pauculus]UAL02298.1 hypothetical protein K8O84_26330 [Cupriavidus pauculus]
MKRNTRECVHLLMEGMQRHGPLRRDALAEACGLTPEETTRALKAARQMSVIDHIPYEPGTTALEIFYQLTGRQLPPARKSSRMPPAPDDRFQPLLEAWWNSSEPDRA